MIDSNIMIKEAQKKTHLLLGEGNLIIGIGRFGGRNELLQFFFFRNLKGFGHTQVHKPLRKNAALHDGEKNQEA